MYDPKSLKAEEFICHEEIEDTLKYADENKDNMPLIREILDKARLCKGCLLYTSISAITAAIIRTVFRLATSFRAATAITAT